MSPCPCQATCKPMIDVDVPHPHHRGRAVACLDPERPVDCDTVWDFDCEACLRHARIIVRMSDVACNVWIPGWPRRLTLRSALALKDPLHPDLPPIELSDHLAEMRDYVENG